MTLPLCPIYAVCLLGIYFLIGTPDEKRGLLKNADNVYIHRLTYALFAFFIPSAAEFFVGLFFHKVFGVRLWNYSSFPLNVNGYICLPISIAWMLIILFFMKYIFPVLKKYIFKLDEKATLVIAGALFWISIFDATRSLINMR